MKQVLCVYFTHFVFAAAVVIELRISSVIPQTEKAA